MRLCVSAFGFYYFKTDTEKSKDFYDGYAENCEGIYGAGESVEAVKEDIVEAIRLLKEHNPVENLPELLKGEYVLDKSCLV